MCTDISEVVLQGHAMPARIKFKCFIDHATLGSICPSVCLGSWELRCPPLQWYRAMLCSTDVLCAPQICVMHHGAPQICVMHHGAQRGATFFRSSGHDTSIFFVYVISYNLDYAQCQSRCLLLLSNDCRVMDHCPSMMSGDVTDWHHGAKRTVKHVTWEVCEWWGIFTLLPILSY